MYRLTRFAAVVLATLALAGCSGGSSLVAPTDASPRHAELTPTDSSAVSTTTSSEGETGRGLNTLGGGT
jgi:hypothetical protein